MQVGKKSTKLGRSSAKPKRRGSRSRREEAAARREEAAARSRREEAAASPGNYQRQELDEGGTRGGAGRFGKCIARRW